MITLASVPAAKDSPAYPDVGLDGIEAQCGPDNTAGAPPGTAGLVLAMPICWREAWMGLPEAARLLPTVPTREQYVEHLTTGLEEARRLRVKYVVIRASHGTPEGILSSRHPYSDYDVLEALLEWVYLAAGEKDLGYEILFENTWHAGLRWNEPRLAEHLLTKFKHPRVGFSFDVGKYLLTLGGTTTEQADMRRLRNFAKSLGKLTGKIRSLVLNRPGAAPVASELVRRVRASTDPAEIQKYAKEFDRAVNAQQPWVSAPLKELVEVMEPAYVVHRLGGSGAAWAEQVKKQHSLLA